MRTRHTLRGLVCAALALACGFACSGEAPREHVPGVVLVVVDTLRRDALGSYGQPGDPTPALDALARDGVRFERAISSSGWTLPAMGSLLTGTWPSVHKALGQRTRLTPISDDVVTGPEILQERAWRTLAVANAAFVSPYLGLARGFDVFDHRHAYNREIRRADESVDRALALLDDAGEAPFFLLLHLFDPHLDYDPFEAAARRFSGAPREPAPPLSGRAVRALEGEDGVPSSNDAAYVRGLYQAEVATVDAELGRFFAALEARGLYDRSLIAVTSDHGEEFWEHGGFEHGHTLHEELVRVPLIVKLPGARDTRKVVAAQVRVLDLLPTVFDQYGVEMPEAFVGASLLPLIEGNDTRSRIAFSESTLYGSAKRAYHGERFSYLIDADPHATPREQLYDWHEDPGELDNRIDLDPEQAELLRAEYRNFAAALEMAAQQTRPGPIRNMSPGHLDEVLEALESLGYIESPDDPR